MAVEEQREETAGPGGSVALVSGIPIPQMAIAVCPEDVERTEPVETPECDTFVRYRACTRSHVFIGGFMSTGGSLASEFYNASEQLPSDPDRDIPEDHCDKLLKNIGRWIDEVQALKEVPGDRSATIDHLRNARLLLSGYRATHYTDPPKLVDARESLIAAGHAIQRSES